MTKARLLKDASNHLRRGKALLASAPADDRTAIEVWTSNNRDGTELN